MSPAAIDKSDWGEGPWQTEPDELSWSFGDVPCRIVRHPRDGNLAGYIGLPKSHPWFGSKSDEIHADCSEYDGITFAGHFDESTFASANPSALPLWWVGFHCGGTFDYQPGWHSREPTFEHDPTPAAYRDLDYVRAVTENLASQAIAVLHRESARG